MAASLTTLYLRGIPLPLAREAKAAAAREGVTLARWVSRRLAGAPVPAVSNEGPEGALHDDLTWYESKRAELERKYGGSYVAIVDRTVVDHDADFDALARRVFTKFGARPICMPRVGRAAVRIRSPRRVRS